MYWISRVLYPNRNTIFVNIDHEQNLKRRTWILFLNGWRKINGPMSTRKTPISEDKNVNTRFISMANMSLYLPKRLLQYRFMHCKSPNIDCLIKELCIDSSLDKEGILEIILGLFCVPLAFHALKNWIVRNYTLNWIRFRTSNLLYCWVFQMLQETSFKFINIYSNSG